MSETYYEWYFYYELKLVTLLFWWKYREKLSINLSSSFNAKTNNSDQKQQQKQSTHSDKRV